MEFIEHYHLERNHQGLDNHRIDGSGRNAGGERPVKRRERLGGVLSYDYREAA